MDSIHGFDSLIRFFGSNHRCDSWMRFIDASTVEQKLVENDCVIMPASDPNGRFEISSGLHLFGLLRLYIGWDLFGFCNC